MFRQFLLVSWGILACSTATATVGDLYAPNGLGALVQVTKIADQREASPLDALIPQAAILPAPGLEQANPQPAIDDELAERRRIRHEVTWLITTSSSTSPDPDIHALEAIFSRYRLNGERTVSGAWKLMVAYDSIPRSFRDLPNASDSTIQNRLKTIDLWRSAYPLSPAPYIYHGYVVAYQAISRLQDRLARPTMPDGIERLRAKLEEARLYLTTYKQIASEDPQWYALMIQIMRAQGSLMAEVLKVTQEGARRYPAYYPIYYDSARAIGTLASNPFKAMETLAKMAVAESSHMIGDELYSRIYRVAVVEVFGLHAIKSLRWNWRKMVASMDTTAQRYDVPYNTQMFVLFGCLMTDQATTRAMLKKSRGTPIPEIWGDGAVYSSCEVFANAAPTTPKMKVQNKRSRR